MGGLFLDIDDGSLSHFAVVGGDDAIAGFEGAKKLPKAVVEHAVGFLEVLLEVFLKIVGLHRFHEAFNEAGVAVENGVETALGLLDPDLVGGHRQGGGGFGLGRNLFQEKLLEDGKSEMGEFLAVSR